MKTLAISPDLSLPLNAATQTCAFIARRGAGKTYGASKFAECLLDADVQIVVLDSVGNWWGLRLSADGKSEGYDIPVIGGLRGDIPLEASGGHLIADIVVDTGRSLIIDVSQFSKADRQRFATAFAERLWSAKKAERHPSPLHLIIEESQLIVPESVRGDTAKMVGIYEEIIRLGRNYGIGVTMISQRPQSVNKEVLNQTECLFVLQVNGSHERKALRDWITYHGAERGLVDELPGLPVGTAYIWSPQWLGILKKIRIGQKKTFDASATPTVGVTQVRRDLKPLDLDDLKTRMAATIEKAKAEDPRELKKKVAALERQLAAKPTATESVREVPVFLENDIQKVESLIAELRSIKADFDQDRERFIGRWTELMKAAQTTSDTLAEAISRTKPWTERTKTTAMPSYRPPAPARQASQQNGSGEISKCARAILQVLSQHPEGCLSGKLTLLTGYRFSGGFKNSLSELRTAGLMTGGNTGTMQITKEGLAAGPFEPLPTGEDLRKFWLVHRSFGPCEYSILRVLIEAYPKGRTAALLCELTGYSYSGGFKNALSNLRTAGVLEGKNTEEMRASDILF